MISTKESRPNRAPPPTASQKQPPPPGPGAGDAQTFLPNLLPRTPCHLSRLLQTLTTEAFPSDHTRPPARQTPVPQTHGDRCHHPGGTSEDPRNSASYRRKPSRTETETTKAPRAGEDGRNSSFRSRRPIVMQRADRCLLD